MHPEVKIICLIILLYAGKSFISKIYNIKDSIKYIYINNVIVLILSKLNYCINNNIIIYRKGLSAGNFINKGTSETIRNNIDLIIEILLYNKVVKTIKDISVHIPKHNRINNDNDLGYYLAGLMDSNSEIINNNMIIHFNNDDYSYMYLIKKQIGYGSIIKGNNCKLIIKSNGIPKVLNLINNKINNKILFTQIINYIKLNNLNIDFILNNNLNILNNYWLSGYLDVNSKFDINLNLINNNLYNIDFNLYIKAPLNDKNNIDNNILNLINSNLKGYIYKDENNNAIYNINSLNIIYKYIMYLRSYHLMSNKYLTYIYWRKTYIRVQNIIWYVTNGIPKIDYYNHETEISKIENNAIKLNKLNNKT